MITATSTPLAAAAAAAASLHHDSGLGSTHSSPDMATAVAMYRIRQQQQQLRRERQKARPPSPMSRTHQYRKVMKPLLERKRRARINKCLDELKDLMVGALQTEGESITKLEKADVLELTVRHLRKLKKQNALGLTPEATYAGRFRAGYTHCAQEVSKFVTKTEFELDVHVSTRLLSHLSSCIQALDSLTPSSLATCIPASTAISPLASPPPLTISGQKLTTNGGGGGGSAFSAVARRANDAARRVEEEDKAWRPW